VSKFGVSDVSNVWAQSLVYKIEPQALG